MIVTEKIEVYCWYIAKFPDGKAELIAVDNDGKKYAFRYRSDNSTYGLDVIEQDVEESQPSDPRESRTGDAFYCCTGPKHAWNCHNVIDGYVPRSNAESQPSTNDVRDKIVADIAYARKWKKNDAWLAETLMAWISSATRGVL